MPRAKSKLKTSTRTSSSAQSWRNSDREWHTALEVGRAGVRDRLRVLSADPVLVRRSHVLIYSAAENYIRSLIGITRRKLNGQVRWERRRLRNPLAAVEAIKRMTTSRTQDALARAWIELPPVARDAINDACVELTNQPLRVVMARWPMIHGTFHQLDSSQVSALIPSAIKIARRWGNRNSVRDNAVIAILEQYSLLINRWPSAKEAARFVESVQSAYKELLPSEGFGVNSDATLYRLLKQARCSVPK
jgi:hypothetical protein